MTNTDRGFFTICFLDGNNKEIQIIEGVDKKNYICATRGESFRIEMVQRRRPMDIVASKLYIDGKEIHGIKTFKSRSYYHGFKMGGGVYKKFLFDIPPLKDPNKSQDQIKEENRNFGKIQIEFFNIVKVMSRKKEKKLAKYFPYNQSVCEEGTKFFERALSVKEGEIFNLDISNVPDKSLASTDEFTEHHIADYNVCIDKVKFYYTDFIALQIKGIVSLNNLSHLQYIPEELLHTKVDYVTTALLTILRNNKKKSIHHVDLASFFEKHTQKSIYPCLGNSDLPTFLKMRINLFTVDINGNVSITDISKLTAKLYELPVQPEKIYFTKIGKGNHNNVINKKTNNSENNIHVKSVKNNKAGKVVGQIIQKDSNIPIEVINLESDDEEGVNRIEDLMEFEV